MYAKVINIRFPPNVTEDMAGVARGLEPILKYLQGYESLEVLTDPEAGEGMIVSFWEKEADAEASETNASYIGQMSMISSFLYEALVPRTYEVNIRA
jgi:heme-degrading monooxygenase HmoA